MLTLFQVVLSACVLSLVFVGGVQMCHSARTSSQPHRLVPLANGMSQLALTLTLLMIAVILPMLAQLRYMIQIGIEPLKSFAKVVFTVV